MFQFKKLWMVICALTIAFASVQTVQAQKSEPECVVLYPPGMASTPPSGYGDPEILEGFNPTTVRRVLIAAHVVRRSNGMGGISSNDINTAITQLNTAYSNAMIEFVLASTDYIDNDTYFELTMAEWATLANINVVARRLNIYFVPQAVGFNGIAYLADRRCAVTNAAAINGSTLAHEVGHNFFLYHTHSDAVDPPDDCTPVSPLELVNGSNCTTAGDYLCDTPAEPFNCGSGISGYVYTNTCGYFGTFRDANNQLYNPDTRNFMGYAPANCRNRFSSQQIQKMNQTLSTILYDLLTIPVTVTNKIGAVNAGGTLTINNQVVSSGGSIELEAGVTYLGKTNHERLQGNNKHHDWDEDASQFRLLQDFQARREHPARDAYFILLSPVSVTTHLIETGETGGNVQFRDPWYLADASGNQPNQFYTYAAPLSPTGAYNQTTGGVFLNQGEQWNPPYYSVRVPQSQTIGGYNANFINWTGTNVAFRNPDKDTSAIVFQQSGATATARYKAHLHSSTSTALASNGFDYNTIFTSTSHQKTP